MPRKAAPLAEGWRRTSFLGDDGKRHTGYIDPDGWNRTAAEYREMTREEPAEELPAAPPVEPRPLESAKAASDPRATSEQISQSLVYVLLIVTGILGFAARDDSLVLTGDEAAEMALPAGNILSGSLLNKRYGKYLRDSGDYTALAYSLTRYGLRVAEEMRTRLEQQRSVHMVVNQPPVGGTDRARSPVPEQTPFHSAGSAPASHPSGSVAAHSGQSYQGPPFGGYSPIPRVSPPGHSNGVGSGHGVSAGDAGETHG